MAPKQVNDIASFALMAALEQEGYVKPMEASLQYIGSWEGDNSTICRLQLPDNRVLWAEVLVSDESIDAGNFKAHVTVISSDGFEGVPPIIDVVKGTPKAKS